MSALIIQWCTYTDSEIAHVGLYVREARERNMPVETKQAAEAYSRTRLTPRLAQLVRWWVRR